MAETLGKYRLEKRIGTGGMADVFLAYGPEGVCVVKRAFPALCASPEFAQMFLDEASLLAQLHHPGIARIFDLGEVNGALFLAMEYVPGFDLMTISLEHERTGELMAPELCAKIIADAAGALHYAHEARSPTGQPLKIIHRDVTPHNILLSTSGVVKLIDFGVARASTARHRTQVGKVKGKYPYMSPEQITDQPIDRRVDIYALGLCLYELLTNVRAIAGNSDLEQIDNARSARIRPIEQLRPNVPDGLRRIINSCLQFAPSARYQTARSLKEDLERFLAGGGYAVGQEDLLRLFRVVAAEASHLDLAPVGPTPAPAVQVAMTEEQLGVAPTAPSMKTPAVAEPLTTAGGPANWAHATLPVGTTLPPDQSPLETVIDPRGLGPARTVVGSHADLPANRTIIDPRVGALIPPGAQTTILRDTLPELGELGARRRRGPWLLLVVAAAAIGLGVAAGAWFAVSTPSPTPRDAASATPDASDRVAGAAGSPLIREADAGEPLEDAAAVARVVDAGRPIAARAARLDLWTDPPCTVMIGNESYGKTPTVLELPAGKHTLTLINREFHFRRTLPVVLREGQVKPLSLAFEKGTLVLRVDPFATMKVNGDVVGTDLSFKELELYVGDYAVELSLDQPTVKKTKHLTVTITPGARVEQPVRMLEE